MSNLSITARFLKCLDQLVVEGKTRSKRQFALALGYHAQGISEMVAGRREVPLDLIEKAIHTFKFNAVYLFTGLGPLFSNPAEDDGLRVKNLTVITDKAGEERIVHVPVPAQAGYTGSLSDPTFFQELPTYQLPDPQFRSGTYRSFEIAGHSMEPVLVPGDILIASFIEPRFWEQALKSGKIYIVVTSQDIVVKRINNHLKANKEIECISENPEFESYHLRGSDILEIWKPSVKMTRSIELPDTKVNTVSITEQLMVQQRMLEHLHHHLTNSKVS
jgi:plasmid maintenance system antidote protein VapI